MNERVQTTYTLEQVTEAVRAALQPVMIYDAATDERRPVTQDDVDRLVGIAQSAAAAKRSLDNPNTTGWNVRLPIAAR